MTSMVTGLLSVKPQLWLAWQRAADTLPDDVAAARRLQSGHARQAAKRAADALSIVLPDISNHGSGAPRFGPALRGSLAHAQHYAAALVGSAAHWQAVGVDIEPSGLMPDDARDFALDPVEQAELARLPGGLAHWALAAFGLKESLHKCLSPLCGITLEFDEVRIRLHPHGQLHHLSARSDRARRALENRQWIGGVHFADGATISWLATPGTDALPSSPRHPPAHGATRHG